MSRKLKLKHSVNLTLNRTIRDLGDVLAAQDHRNLSAEVDWLIETEAAKRGLKPTHLRERKHTNGNGKTKS